MGMALRQASVASTVVGHDKKRGAADQARRLGAVDRTDWNLVSACEGSDLVILATPLGAVKETLEAVGPNLKPGTVMVDTIALKMPVIAWADEILPDHVHFVGGNPIIGGIGTEKRGAEAARADLFRNGLFCLVPAPGADEAAVKMATDLVSVLGAKPVFFDPAEHDGLLAAVDHLMPMLSLALLEMVTQQPTWRELRKLAGSSFEARTHLPATDLSVYSDLCLSNRENILRWIDAFSVSLGSVREALVADDSQSLLGRFEGVQADRDRWLQDRADGHWGEGVRSEMPERPSLADSFLGTFWRRGSRGEQ
jgi:prephenate dehydrogenase